MAEESEFNPFRDTPIELMVKPDLGGQTYSAYWSDGACVIERIHYTWVDLIHFMVARTLLSHGYNAARPFIVRLQGADYDLCRTSLGAAAATPLVNSATPVEQPLTCVYQRSPIKGAVL